MIDGGRRGGSEAERYERCKYEDHREAEKRDAPEQAAPWPLLLRPKGVATDPRRHEGRVPRVGADSLPDRVGSLTAS
jgi:hypothetical protein